MTATTTAPISAPRRAAVQRWSRTLIPTAKEPPADAESISHRLLARGGFVRRVGAGVYDYLPLGHRVVQKVAQIVREEMNDAGASELFLPHLTPIEGYFSETGRADAYGDLLFRFRDRHGRDTALGPTHEEVITELMRGTVNSYKQLPLNLYQIQTKFRDEFRPRAGLLRGREFLMKDAYSFHVTVEGAGGLNETYDAMYAAYERIFERCGLDFTVVEAEAGPIGGSASHEFMVNAESGEDTILVCPMSGYAANVEKCEIGERASDLTGGAPTGDLEDLHTPDCPGIDDVCAHFKKELGTKLKPANMLKSILFVTTTVDDDPDPAKATSPWYVLAIVRGDHEVNEGKLRDEMAALLGGPVHLGLAPEELARTDEWAIGFIGPHAFEGRDDTYLIIDPDAAHPGFWVTGANTRDHHVKHFHWPREVPSAAGGHERVRLADVRNAVAGDPSPRAEGTALEARRGIEVGHIFKLGDKYSRAMGFNVLDEHQHRVPVMMGCYGIGVSRVVAACVEMSADDDGIIWPDAIAPYHAIITIIKPDESLLAQADELAASLADAGLDVLIDDRDERPGAKFKDADLVGIPIRLTVSEKSLQAGGIEFKRRGRTGGDREIVALDAVAARCGVSPA
ncbi:MAG: proline--tRNA ligase [Planctomycetota bacterium]